MTIIHMDTEQIRNLVQQMRTSASTLDAQSDWLNDQLRRLRSAWEGERAQDFDNEMRRLTQQIDDHIQLLELLAAQVQREVDEWEAADRERAFGRWHDLYTWADGARAPLEILDREKELLKLTGLGLTAWHTTLRNGEIVFTGKNWYRRIAELPPNLRHIKPENFAKHLAKNSKVSGLDAAIGVLEFADKGIEDFARYQDGSDRAAALAYDAAFVTTKTALKPIVQHAVMTTVGTVALGALATVGAPAVVVVGAGVAIWWGSGFLLDKGADALYAWADNAGFKDKVVQWCGEAIDTAISAGQSAARAVDSAFRGVVRNISTWFR